MAAVPTPAAWPGVIDRLAMLIAVGVALDTMGQLEAHLIMRHYEGFLKKGRIQGRWFNVGSGVAR